MNCTYSIVNDKDDTSLYIVPSSWTFVKKNVSLYIVYIYIYIYIYSILYSNNIYLISIN